MSEHQTTPRSPGRWRRRVYALLVIAAFVAVMFAWFHTPMIRVASADADQEYTTLRCLNAGPSRWDTPIVQRSQELQDYGIESTAQILVGQSFNLQLLKNDLESLREDLACGRAISASTNTLIVTVFAAGTVIFLGHAALWKRRDSAPEPVLPRASPVAEGQ